MIGRAALRRVLAAAVLLAGSLVYLASAAPPAMASGPAIIGAGSTWSEIAIDQWRADVYRLGLQVNYQGVGSTTGRQFFAGGTVDFAGSEIPFQPEDPQVTRQYAYLPVVAGGTSMMYNLKSPSGQQIRDLRLSPPTIAGIFTGQITNWNDRRIQADYGKPLPDLPIQVVVRSDGSGTSAQFSAYLNGVEPSMWKSFLGACQSAYVPYTSFWPFGQPNCLQNAVGQRGSDGIANYVANPGLGNGAIGYLEAAYAVARSFPVVAVKNQSGAFTIPTPGNVAIALQHAHLNPDSTQNLTDVYTAPEKDAYPISSYSYMIVPTDGSITTAKGAVLGRFIIYFACQGQQEAAPLGYSPMPKALVQFAFAAEKEIPGAPKPPPIDAKHCNNPNLSGNFANRGGGTLTGTEPWTPAGRDNAGGSDGGSSGGSNNGTPSPGGGTQTGGPPTGSSLSDGTPTLGGGTSTGGTSTGGTEYVTVSPSVIGKRDLIVAEQAGAQQIKGSPSPDMFPLVVLAVAILLLIFGPLVLRLRSRR